MQLIASSLSQTPCNVSGDAGGCVSGRPATLHSRGERLQLRCPPYCMILGNSKHVSEPLEQTDF